MENVFFTVYFHDLFHGDTKITRGDQGLQGITKSYRVLQRVTRGYNKLQRVREKYRRLAFLTSTFPDTFSSSIMHKT